MSNLQHADRELALLRTFRAAFAALDDLRGKQPDAAARIADVVASHMRSAHPMASIPALAVTEPVAAIARDLGEGARIDLSAEGDCTILSVRDPHDGHAVVALTEQARRALVVDLQAVRHG